MAGTVNADNRHRAGDSELLQTLLSDYKQARATLDQAAITCRGRESRLRKLMTSVQRSSVRPAPRVTPSTESPAVPPSIAFYCLGKFQVEVAGTRVEGLATALRILKFLVHRHGLLISRELLLETFWPESEPEAASNRRRSPSHRSSGGWPR